MPDNNRQYPPKFKAVSIARVFALQMNAEGALLLFDTLREASTTKPELLDAAAVLEEEFYKAGVFGIRSERRA